MIELDELVIRRVAVGPMDNNAYLLTERGGAQLLVDAADEPDRLVALLQEGSGSARLLHGHPHPEVRQSTTRLPAMMRSSVCLPLRTARRRSPMNRPKYT